MKLTMDANGRNGERKMTLLLWFALGAVLNLKVSDLGVHSAEAGWEYNESARPPKKKSLYPKAVSPKAGAESPAEAAPEAVEPSARVQVFGKPAPEMSAEDYAKMLKEDQAGTSAPAEAEAAAETSPSNPVAPVEAPVVVAPPPAAVDPSVDPEFEALRARIRTRQVAENNSESESDSKPAPKRKTIRPQATPSYIPPPPPMETEVITPQKATGKKVKTSKTAPAVEGDAPRNDEVNAAFPYTHLLPSPLNIPKGSYVFGSTVAYGLFDSFEISTNVMRTISQQWNFRAKVPLVEYPTFIASAFVDYTTFNANHYDESNPDEWTKRWQPGLVTGYEITPDIAFFLGGNFSFGKATNPIMTTSGYLHGATANMEWSWMYNPSTSRLGNNAISLGIKYDFTYSMLGFGFTHHWKAFELGVHYTFADRSRFLPMFGFNVGANF
jgi:hypothetical protein